MREVRKTSKNRPFLAKKSVFWKFDRVTGSKSSRNHFKIKSILRSKLPLETCMNKAVYVPHSLTSRPCSRARSARAFAEQTRKHRFDMGPRSQAKVQWQNKSLNVIVLYTRNQKPFRNMINTLSRRSRDNHARVLKCARE